MSKLWGGRFSGSLDPFFAEFNRSLGYDRRLFEQDLDGSIAWAKALGEAGVLKKGEVSKLQRAIKNLRQKVQADPGLLEAEDEDIHSFVERMLGEEVGSLARKLHAGRSRNDQVATDLKLYLRQAVEEVHADCTALMSRLVALAAAHPDTPLPGYTHLQRAQPLTVGHHALAYVEMLDRDRGRLEDAAKRMDTCPLGSAALAGSGLPVDRRQIAADLGFAGPTRNSIDSVADRDHVCELLFSMSM
ncbi:MAG: argininosuccinate lyase, partial [Planctomycetota bacterium]